MADIDDRWHRKTPAGPVRTARFGQGRRWLVRYRDPAGDQRSKSFHRKKDAEAYAASVTTDMRTGNYVDPAAGKITVGEWIDLWLPALGHLKESSRIRTVGVIEHHVRPRWGTTPLVGITHGRCPTRRGFRWRSDDQAAVSV